MAVTINGTTGIDKIQDGSIVTADFASSVPLGTKNLIINGAMQIAQRGTSSTGITSSSGAYYTIDRMGAWMTTAGTWTMSQDSDVPTGQGFANSMKWSCTTANASLSAGSYMHLTHNIEAQNLQHLKFGSSSAESITLSFWVKSNKTGTYVVEFHQDDAGKTLSKTYTIDSADTWEKKTITVTGNTNDVIANDNGMGLQIWHWLVAGTNFSSGTANSTWTTRVIANDAPDLTVNLADSTSNYINITGFQLEVGDVATSFQHIPFDAELKRCSRYYQKTFRYSYAPYTTDNENRMYFTCMANSSTVIGNPGVRPIYQEGKMRTAPTITLYDTSGNSGKLTYTRAGQPASSNITATVDQIGENAFRVSTSSASSLTAGQAVILLFYYTANAEL